MLKKITVGLAVLACIVSGSVFLLLDNLDHLVKSAIEKYGSAVTGVPVQAGGVHISTSTGEGSISELTVSNPKGFSAAYAFQTGKISLAVDAHSLFGNGPIILREITVESPQVTFEVNDTVTSNLQVILQHVKSASGAPTAAGTKETAPPDHKPERKIIIRDLTIRGGQLHIAHNLLQGKVITAPLSTIRLMDIGQDSDGTTPALAAKQVLTSILSTAMRDAESQLPAQAGPLKNVTDKLKGLFR